MEAIMLKRILVCTVTLVAGLSTLNVQSVEAAQLSRQKIGQWGDPLTPPQSRTSCVNYASGNWSWGGGWKTCVGWKTEWRHMEVEMYLQIDGPSNASEAVRQAVIDCAKVAAAAAVGAGVYTGGSAALAAGKVAFEACTTAKA